jgi:hypothetical protein
MSKGHLEALALLRARQMRRVASVTKPPAVTKPAKAPKGGRPKVHGSAAEKQKAYRGRSKAKA